MRAYKVQKIIKKCGFDFEDANGALEKVYEELGEMMKAEELGPIRDRRKEFEKDIPAVYEMLRKGCEVARETASATLDEVRRAMKINYFDDADLIAEQAKRFAGE